jgi:hypothetical protein
MKVAGVAGTHLPASRCGWSTPGSPTDERFRPRDSPAFLDIERGRVRGRLVSYADRLT